MQKEKRLSIRVTEKLFNRVVVRAEEKGLTITDYIRYLISKDIDTKTKVTTERQESNSSKDTILKF